LLAGALCGAHAADGEWPTQTVKIIVGYPAGTSPDTAARIIAEPLSQVLGKPVVVENKPGAGGNIGVQTVLTSADSHTFGLTTNGPLTTARQLFVKVPFDPVKDVMPLTLLATSPLILILNTNAPPKNLKEFMVWAKEQSGGITFGSIGQGSGSHLTMELFARRAGLSSVHVPYQGFPQVTNAIVGQQINTAFMAPSGALAQAKAGKVRILGISSPERSPLAPDVPTIAESGLPGFQAELWIAAFAANNLPPVAAARLTREINALLQRADVKEKFLQQGWKAMGTSGEDMARRIQQDTTVWSQVIRDAGIKPE
jgi:tripartite-type tricarboxylate transporter receptor subunit TctC